jgi:hypothetical protein
VPDILFTLIILIIHPAKILSNNSRLKKSLKHYEPGSCLIDQFTKGMEK